MNHVFILGFVIFEFIQKCPSYSRERIISIIFLSLYPPDVYKNFKFGGLRNPSFKHNMDWIRLDDRFFQTSVLKVGCCSYLRNSLARSEQNWLSIHAGNFDCHVFVRRPAHVIYCAIRVKVNWQDDSYPNGYPRPFSQRYHSPWGAIDNFLWRDRERKVVFYFVSLGGICDLVWECMPGCMVASTSLF